MDSYSAGLASTGLGSAAGLLLDHRTHLENAKPAEAEPALARDTPAVRVSDKARGQRQQREQSSHRGAVSSGARHCSIFTKEGRLKAWHASASTIGVIDNGVIIGCYYSNRAD